MESWEKLQPIVHPIIDKESQGGFGSLDEVERTLYLVWSYSVGVNDGGHEGFFTDLYGEFALETLEALAKLPDLTFHRILERAVGLFPDRHVPKDLDERTVVFEEVIERQCEVVEALDAEFFGIGSDSLMDSLLAYHRRCRP